MRDSRQIGTLLRRRSRRLVSVLADESGISLLIAVLTLVVLSIVTGSVAVYTTSNTRQAVTDRSAASAYHLAEAGLNDAVSKLSAATTPTDTTLLASTTVGYPEMGGTVTYAGTGSQVNNQMVWNVTSTGTVTVAGPTGARSKTLKQTVVVRGLVPGADLGSWSRFYQDSNASCLTLDTVSMPAPIATKGPLCLLNGASITGASTTVDVGGNVYIQGPPVDSSPRNPSAGSGWTNSSNAYTSNNTYATYAISRSSDSAVLVVSGFGFTIPTTAKILGISVDVERKATATSDVRDTNVYLQKTTANVGTDHTYNSYWPTSDATHTYGSTSDLWGTTWTPAEINASTFGLRLQAHDYDTQNADTAYVDAVSITITYTNSSPAAGIGTSTTPIADATIAGTCQYNNAAAHTPCTTADHVYANTVTMSSINPDLAMPTLDLSYWFNEARPGPKHPCTNSNNNMSPLVFDNDNSSGPNNSLIFDNSPNYDMTPTGRDYDCQYVENGLLYGQLAWNHTTHVLTVSGTIFFDGDVRFDDDGQLVHYQGRALIYAAGDIEFDEMVCAGGTGTGSGANCSSSMSSWNPQQNYLVLMANGNSEYDQGGSSCSGMPAGVVCAANGIHPQSGFQGVVSAQGDCLIHEQFKLSGPVICNTISLPYESDGWPTIYPFPSLSAASDLVDGQKYGDIDTAQSFEVQPGATTG